MQYKTKEPVLLRANVRGDLQMSKNVLNKMILSEEIRNILSDGKKLFIPNSRFEILHFAMGECYDTDVYEVAYDVEGVGSVVEATVTRCKNGLSVNYPEVYMRRRDPNAMLIDRYALYGRGKRVWLPCIADCA